jgi:predicted GIY-YIG superfamily endonuclease
VKTWVVYMLMCGDGSLYTGITNDLAKRLQRHNLGEGAKYTAPRLPVTLVWSTECKDRSTALKEELRIKALSRSQKQHIINSMGQ